MSEVARKAAAHVQRRVKDSEDDRDRHHSHKQADMTATFCNVGSRAEERAAVYGGFREYYSVKADESGRQWYEVVLLGTFEISCFGLSLIRTYTHVCMYVHVYVLEYVLEYVLWSSRTNFVHVIALQLHLT
jgi:hypothetical protein